MLTTLLSICQIGSPGTHGSWPDPAGMGNRYALPLRTQKERANAIGQFAADTGETECFAMNAVIPRKAGA